MLAFAEPCNLAAILVHHDGAPTWRRLIICCKNRTHLFAYISVIKYSIWLKFGKVTIFWELFQKNIVWIYVNVLEKSRPLRANTTLLFRFLPENNLTDERLIPESFKQFKWLLLICNWTSTMMGRMLCVNWSSCLYWIKLQRGLVHVIWFMMTNVQNTESVIFYHNPSGPVGNFLGKKRVRVYAVEDARTIKCK